MARVERTALAEQDIEEILTYLDDHSRPAARRFLKAPKSTTESLSQMPEMGRKREELAPGLRSFNADKYLLFYRPIPEGILLIRVTHGSRDLPGLFEG